MPSKFKDWVDLVASLAMIGAASTIVWVVWSRPSPVRLEKFQVPSEPVSLSSAYGRGGTGAKVVVVQYSDFQCPFCGRFAREVEPEFIETYVKTGRVSYFFKHFPLESIHPQAVPAAIAAHCAWSQGQFEGAQALLFRAPPRLDSPTLAAMGTDLGLDATVFETCTRSQDTEKYVRDNLAEAMKLGVPSTPSFMVGELRADGNVDVRAVLSGMQTLSSLGAAVEQILK